MEQRTPKQARAVGTASSVTPDGQQENSMLLPISRYFIIVIFAILLVDQRLLPPASQVGQPCRCEFNNYSHFFNLLQTIVIIWSIVIKEIWEKG